MTIRQKIVRTWVWGMVIFFGAFIGFGVAGALLNDDRLMLAIIIPFLVIVLLLNFGMRCPRCGGNLAILSSNLFPIIPWKHLAKYCPFCAVPLDEECSTARSGTRLMK